MDILIEDVRGHVEKLAKGYATMQDFANSIGVSRQTLYNVMAGNWPTHAVAQKLGLRLVVKSKQAI